MPGEEIPGFAVIRPRVLLFFEWAWRISSVLLFECFLCAEFGFGSSLVEAAFLAMVMIEDLVLRRGPPPDSALAAAEADLDLVLGLAVMGFVCMSSSASDDICSRPS